MVDECVISVACEGNCDHVGCSMAQLQRLNTLKNHGSRRNSPMEKASVSNTIKCPQCNFTSSHNNEVEAQVKKEHGTQPSCPFCLVGFHHLGALKRHIEQNHKESTPVTREARHRVSKNPCIFFLQRRGCKKGQNCDFSHVSGESYQVIKIQKLCLNGLGCNWKPRCRYVHPEDGEIIQPRVSREQGGRPHPREQGFGHLNCNQPPPGYNYINKSKSKILRRKGRKNLH